MLRRLVDATFWFALVSLLVAIGGAVVNARAIRREETDRKEQIDAEWAREWAAQRPLVYPLALAEWAYASEGTRYRGGNARVLPLKNGGRGPALSVRGTVTATSPQGASYEREILAGTIAAGDLLDARIAPHPGVQHWNGAAGTLCYRDLAGTEYETRFECSHGPGNELVVTAHEQTVTPQRGQS